LQRISPDRLGDIFELLFTEITDGKVEPGFDLSIGIFGQAD
jgi:hypothetical protein